MNILTLLEKRFEDNPFLVKENWDTIQAVLETKDLTAVETMESLHGEPAVYDYDAESNTVTFVDSVMETAEQRANITYNQKGEDKRIKDKMPVRGNALSIVASYGGTLLSEAEYLQLQSMKAVDLKTSVWLLTPPEVESKGGALTGDNRYGRAFIYHNGVQSFYKVRGFRSKLIV